VWQAGTWAAGDDYGVDEILDARPATAQDVLDYADTPDAGVELGTEMYLIKWTGWSSAYNSWEPHAFIADDELIEVFNAKKARGLDGASARRWPDEVLEVRRTHRQTGGRPRLEARCRWVGQGEVEMCEEWRHATRKEIGSRAMKEVRRIDAQASETQDNTRVHPTRGTRGALSRKREAEEEAAAEVRAPRRRRPLRVIYEDDGEIQEA
jgi:hypothetical protein